MIGNKILESGKEIPGSAYVSLDKWRELHDYLRRAFFQSYKGNGFHQIELNLSFGRLSVVVVPHVPADHISIGKFSLREICKDIYADKVLLDNETRDFDTFFLEEFTDV